MMHMLKQIADSIDPRIRHHYRIYKMGKLENEIKLLPVLCDRSQIALDVGANLGLYVHNLIPIARKVYGFEPLPEMQTYLTRMYGGRFVLEAVALSDQDGEVEIRLPAGNPSWATIAKSNQLQMAPKGAPIVSHIVKTRRLDGFDLRNIGLIKIDVEGNEEAVLAGGEATIKREQPSIIVEVEERHNVGSVRRVELFLKASGYSGYYLKDGSLVSLEHFEETRDQDARNVGVKGKTDGYINNFVYIHAGRLAALKSGHPTLFKA